MVEAHNRLIADAARRVLQPQGFVRKARSRVWLRDYGWWTLVVEFQPSAGNRGSDLNVGAHWLWCDKGHISFDHLDDGPPPSISYQSTEQFGPAAIGLAELAGVRARRVASRFPSLDATAAWLAATERALPAPAQGSWTAYDAAVAAALCGRTAEAAQFFESITDERVTVFADRVARTLPDPTCFEQAMLTTIAAQRAAIGLPRLSGDPRRRLAVN